MPKKPTYDEADHDQVSKSMMEHINHQAAEQRAAEQEAVLRKIEARKKVRQAEMLEYIGKCIASAAAVILLILAMNAELIVPTLVAPASYLCFIYFGWCLCIASGKCRKGKA